MVDGSISAFRIHDGHVDYQQRYVKTDRFMEETKYRRNLFGKYRNPFTGISPPPFEFFPCLMIR